MSDFLELDESELFDAQDDGVQQDPSFSKPSSPAAALGGEPTSDDDDASGLVLPGFEDDEEAPTSGALPMPSAAPRAIEFALRAAELGTSGGGAEYGTSSRVGSMRAFDPAAPALKAWNSEGDLGVAASVPTGRMADYGMLGGQPSGGDAAYLGTSMPIRIPLMQRRGLAGSPASLEGGIRARFVPPHLIEAPVDLDAEPGTTPLNLSPSAAAKREKLVARNAILRSTGFIEVQSFAAPGVGEVIDAVKESVMPAVTKPMAMQRRPTAPSSLTALLGSSR